MPERFLCHCVRCSSGLSTVQVRQKQACLGLACCCCVHMHTPWAACNRSPSLPLRNLHSTPHPHPHAQMPVASCFPVLSSATDIKAALDPALFPLSLLLLPSASHWVLVLLELPCATLVLDSSTRLKDSAQGSLSLLCHPPLAGCLLAGRVSVSSWRRPLQVSRTYREPLVGAKV